VSLAAKLCVRPPNVLEVQQRARGPLSPYQVWCGLDFTRRRGGEKTLSFLSVRHAFLSVALCLSVTLLNVRVCSPDFAKKALENRNDFDAVDRGRFVVAYLCSTFSDCRQLSTSLNAEVQKWQKNWGFRRQRAIE